MSVMLDSGVSVYNVSIAMVMAVEAVDIAVRYLNEAETTTAPPNTEHKEVDKI
jgi:hypothetical protein